MQTSTGLQWNWPQPERRYATPAWHERPRRRAKRRPQAPRPAHKSGNVSGSAKSIEQQLFFGRIRRQAKWVFALLAIVFAVSFVFLGVGSGSSGLGDLFHGNFHLFGGGSSGSSVQSLQKKVAAHPRNLQANLDLAQALVREKRTADAIPVVQRYLRLQPRSQEALGQLAALYERRARVLEAELRLAGSAALPLVDPAEFAPGGTIGTALSSFPDAFIQTLQAHGAARQSRATAATPGQPARSPFCLPENRHAGAGRSRLVGAGGVFRTAGLFHPDPRVVPRAPRPLCWRSSPT